MALILFLVKFRDMEAQAVKLKKAIDLKFKYTFFITLFWILLDQITKFYIQNEFSLGESISVIYGFFDITFAQNFGAAFGFLANFHPTFRGMILYTTPVVATFFILYMIHNEKHTMNYSIIALSSILGGALGNFFDRVRLGFVVDFLDFHLNRAYTWPTFNIADIAIVMGVSVLLFVNLYEPHERRTSKYVIQNHKISRFRSCAKKYRKPIGRN